MALRSVHLTVNLQFLLLHRLCLTLQALPPNDQKEVHIGRIYTVANLEKSGTFRQTREDPETGWPAVLQHFLASIAASPAEAVEVKVLRFNASSLSRLKAIGGDLPLDAWQHSKYFEDSKRQGALNRPRWLAWHVAMFFKALSWARVARERDNAGRSVLCADADHTFFPGWRHVVESCLRHHDLCFETNFRDAGTPMELRQASITLPVRTPNATFWRHAWVNTGLFAMRCGPAAHEFWTLVVKMMRLLFSRHGMASDQTSANAILKDEAHSINWGLLDPYAINQASPFLFDNIGPSQRPHSRRMLQEMVIHHAAYMGTSCVDGMQAADCKLRFMRRVADTWFANKLRYAQAPQMIQAACGDWRQRKSSPCSGNSS